MVPQVRQWAAEQAGGPCLPGLLAYLGHLHPDSAGRAVVDDEAAGWALQDGADLAGLMAAVQWEVVSWLRGD